MNAFRLGNTIIASIVCFGVVSAGLVYDPITNTYKNTSTTTPTTQTTTASTANT